jgi:hypothetical protein
MLKQIKKIKLIIHHYNNFLNHKSINKIYQIQINLINNLIHLNIKNHYLF